MGPLICAQLRWSKGLIKGGVGCKVLSIWDRSWHGIKHQARENEDPTADEWTNTKIPIKHHNLDTLHIVALLERLRQLITSNKVVKICQIS